METKLMKLVGPSVTDADIAKAFLNPLIKTIELENCDYITDVSPLANIKTLEEISICNCKRLRYLGSLGQEKTALRKLILKGTPITWSQRRDINSGHVEVILEEDENFSNLDRPSQSLVKSSIDMIREVASQFKPEEIGIAFNGGKDSVVVMDLIKCALGPEIIKKCCVFTLGVSGKEEFNEIVSFRNTFAEANNLSIVTTDSSLSMKDGLAYLKEIKGINLVFMGTRSSDSAHQKKSVERTTKGWPDMLRACPVFNWEYKDIWGYTLTYKLPFCRLYELGYTSLGCLGATSPNPLLRRSDGTFRPAWELHDTSSERDGRLLKA